MNKEIEVPMEGGVDPPSSQQAQSMSSQESQDSRKGKRSPFAGAKDAFKKLVRTGSSRTSNSIRSQLRETPHDFIENPEAPSKHDVSGPLHRTTPLKSKTKQGSENDESPDDNRVSPCPGAKERRSRWNRSKVPSQPKQTVYKKSPVVAQVTDGKENISKDSTVARKSSRNKPPQNPTDLDVESVTHTLRAMGLCIESKLGEGTYAKVRSAFSNKLGKRVALKIVSKARLNSRFQRKFLPRELSILQTIGHRNVIQLYQVIEKQDTIIMVMELARHGDLLEYIQRKKYLPNGEARTIFGNILDAIEYLHGHGVFHRDLKCENVLLDWAPSGIVAKLTDFGFAREWCEASRLCRTYCGSAAYASPEILQGTPYDPHGTDIWSIGVVLFIMVTGRMPYDDSNITESLACMMNDRLDWPSRRPVCKEVKDLLRSILRHELRERATISQMRSSAWMQGRPEITARNGPIKRPEESANEQEKQRPLSDTSKDGRRGAEEKPSTSKENAQ